MNMNEPMSSPPNNTSAESAKADQKNATPSATQMNWRAAVDVFSIAFTCTCTTTTISGLL